MKTFVGLLTSLTLIFLIHTAFLPMFLCRDSLPFPVAVDANLIEQTCKQTPNYHLCEAFLRSDSRSLNAADVKGLIFIMIDIVTAKASESVNKIHELLDMQSPGEQQALLASCIDNYNNVLEYDVPQASQALNSGDNMTAEDRLKDAYYEVGLCDDRFSGSSVNPLKDFNKASRDAADLGAAIAETLI